MSGKCVSVFLVWYEFAVVVDEFQPHHFLGSLVYWKYTTPQGKRDKLYIVTLFVCSQLTLCVMCGGFH